MAAAGCDSVNPSWGVLPTLKVASCNNAKKPPRGYRGGFFVREACASKF
jgi:hypothetical protein